jgi:hypothetical protein
VPAQPEDMTHAPPFEVGDQLLRGGSSGGHRRPPTTSVTGSAGGGSGRGPGPR